MPRIREYTNTQGLDAGPLASAGGNAAQAGYYQGQNIERGFSDLARTTGEVEQHVAQNETSKLAADFATAQSELTTQWADTARKADPNDHEAANRFMNDVVRPRLEALGDGLMTQQAQSMYQKAAAGLHADLFSKTSADQSQLAGVAAITNLDTIKNQLSNAVRNDPASLPNTLKMADITTEGLVQAYGLPREKALELGQSVREEIAKSAFIGMADANPQAAKAALASGQFSDYFDGTTAKAMASYADEQDRAATSAQRAAEAEQRRQEKDQFNNAQAVISASVVDPETGDIKISPDYFKTVTQLALMPGADGGAVRAMLSAGQAIVREQAKGIPAVTDPHAYSDFANRMYLGRDEPNQLSVREVDLAKSRGELSDKDYTFFRRVANEQTRSPKIDAEHKDFNDFLKSMKGYITKSTMLATFPQQDQRYYEFQSDARATFDKMRAAGKSVDEAKAAVRASIPQYQISTKQGISIMQQQAVGSSGPIAPIHSAAPARMPNESPAAYLKRTGGL